MNTHDLTGAGILRALGGFRASATRAVAARADELAAAVAGRHPGANVTVVPHGSDAVVNIAAPGLFAREFGSRDAAPDPVVGPAVADLGAP